MIIAFACDHAGYPVKEKIIGLLKSLGHNIIDCGCFKPDSCDYPDVAAVACKYVSKGACDRAVLVCSSGIGMSIVANKFPRIRAALCYSGEVAKLISQHNNANVICLGANFFPVEELADFTKIWLETPFDSASERHKRRIDKIMKLDKMLKTC